MTWCGASRATPSAASTPARHNLAVSAIDQTVGLRRQIAEVEHDHATQDPEMEEALDVRAWILTPPADGQLKLLAA